MSDLSGREFNQFEVLLSKWSGAYVCAVCSYVGMKTPEGPRLLFGRVLLEPSCAETNETPFDFETEHVFAGRFVRAMTSDCVVAAITKAKAGRMDGPKHILSLATEPSGSLSAHFAPVYHPFITDGPRLPSLLIRGMSKHNLLAILGDARQLDWELRAADAPFDTLDELLGHCGLPTLMQMGDSATLEIVARTPAAIGAGSIISGSEAVIECRVASALDVGKLRLGHRIFRKDLRVDRGSVAGDTFQWRDDNDLKVAVHRIPVGEASLLQAYLSYDGIALHHWWITDQRKHLNPRHAIHQAFDQDLELLRRMLFAPDTDKPYAFEWAVSALLSLLGFSVVNYGRIPKLQKGPDIIAFTPLGHVGVIECTVGLLNENDKLAKLVQRAKLTKERLANAGYGLLRVQPAIVTPLSREEVAADLHVASRHGIAVVCKEEIEGALNRVGLPPNADKTFGEANRLIPGSDQVSLFKERICPMAAPLSSQNHGNPSSSSLPAALRLAQAGATTCLRATTHRQAA